MKKLLIATASALALIAAAPAAAQSRTDFSVGTSVSTDFRGDFSYGVEADLTRRVVGPLSLGVEAAVEDFIDDEADTTLYAGARAKLDLIRDTSLYGGAGITYRTTSKDTGYRLSAGLQQNLPLRTYVRVGYQYDEGNIHSGTLGFGLRF